MVDVTDRLNVLLKLEVNRYRTYDYLPRHVHHPFVSSEGYGCDSRKKHNSSSTHHHNSSSAIAAKALPEVTTGYGASYDASNMMNERWREKICEWAYQGKY